MSTFNPTADQFFDLLPTDLGTTLYIEIIIIERASDVSVVKFNTACGRSCGQWNGFTFYRDLCCWNCIKTVKMALNGKGRKTANFIPYYRNFNTNALSPANFDDPVKNRQSLVFADNTMTAGELAFAMEHIGTTREILPSRVPN